MYSSVVKIHKAPLSFWIIGMACSLKSNYEHGAQLCTFLFWGWLHSDCE